MNKTLDENIVDNDNFDLKSYSLIVGIAIGMYVASQLIHWFIYLKFFKINSLDVRTGRRIRVSSPKVLWFNVARLVRYYVGLARSKTSGKFILDSANSKKNDKKETDTDKINTKSKENESDYIFTEEEVRIDAMDCDVSCLSSNEAMNRPSTGPIEGANSLINNTLVDIEDLRGTDLIKDELVSHKIRISKLEKIHSGENNDLNFAPFPRKNEENLTGKRDEQTVFKKHIKLAAYFGQNLRRMVFLELGIFSIMFIQLLFSIILGIAFFPSWDHFRKYLRGDFLYKDYLGVVTANCFGFGFLTFLVSYIMAWKEFTSQKVIYREVLKNELNPGNKQEQRKFLSPHVVYLSGLDKQSTKYKIEEELEEFIDYIEGSENVCSENGSLILNSERGDEISEDDRGFGKGFRAKLRFNKETGKLDESVDRVILKSQKEGLNCWKSQKSSFKNITGEIILISQVVFLNDNKDQIV